MNAPERPEGEDAISAEDAERLLAGADVDPDAPTLIALREFFACARQPGDDAELAQRERVVAAFGATRTASPPPTPRSDTVVKAISRRTMAIIGIAMSASLGTAFATGAVDVPFSTPRSSDQPPDTTQHPLDPPASSLTIPAAQTDSAVQNTYVPSAATVAEPRLTSSAAATTRDPEPEPVGEEPGETPSVTAPGQTGVSPSATAPGQTGQTPSVTAPGQTVVSPSVTAPGQTGQTPSTTAPGQTGQAPPVTAPGQTGVNPSATAPGQTGQTPSVTAPSQAAETPSVTAPGQTGQTPSITAPGQTAETPSVTAPGQTDRTGRAGHTPSATTPGQVDSGEDS